MKTLLLFLLVFVFVTGRVDAKDPKLPSLERALSGLPTAGFTDAPVQIPATVVEDGILRYVPYVSFRIGSDRELNVYGDLTAPACVEFGLYRTLLNSEEERRRCISYLSQIFPEVDFSGVRLTGGKLLTGGIVVEVTPPDAADAYGGWWISAYSLPLIHAAAGTTASVSVVSYSRDDAALATDWSVSDLDSARQTASGHGGRVYVKAYTRKDGTYVRGHTRSK